MASRICLATLTVLAAAIACRAHEPAKFATETIEGRVVYLAEALDRKFGVKSSEDATERILAIEKKDGTLVPLVEDGRGRAFRVDKRLRGMDLSLMVRRYEGSPAAQVLRVRELAKDGAYEIDYWCDICSIVMFELKECECCQEMNVLRRRKVDQ